MADTLSTRDQLGAWLRLYNYKRVVEIGTQRGEFARQLLNTWDGELVLIDAWRHLPDYNDISNVSDADQLANFAATQRVMRDFAGRVVIARGLSTEVAEQFPDNYFDAIYLDACHSKEAVLADLAVWTPKVRPGGAYIGHDYVDGHFPEGVFGVKSAVLEFFGRAPDIVTEDLWPTWVIQKPLTQDTTTVSSGISASALVPLPITEQNSADVLLWQASHARLCPPPELDGRGVVICGGGRYAASAWVAIKMLRHLGSALPIQVWYLGPDEMPPQLARAFAAENVTTVDAYAVRKMFPHKRLNGWEVKAYCLLHCPWREVMLLDADNLPLQNVDKLFDDEEYKKTGALFWPDRGRWPADAKIWKLSGIPYRDEAEFETGQMLVDRQRCWQAVVLSNMINEDSAFWYAHIHGDKDTFRLAWRSLNMPYGMIPHMASAPWPFFYQKDRAGQMLFHHGYKWDGKPESNQPFGTDTPVISYSGVCFNAIREFETAFNGTPAPVNTPLKIQTGRTVVLQFANGGASEFLDCAAPLHAHACSRYGYDYVVEREAKSGRHAYWEKHRMISDYAARGYDFICWLDTDALWLGETPLLDVWANADPRAVFAATFHGDRPHPGDHYYNHVNAGVLFVRNVGGVALSPLELWGQTDDEGHPWGDQHAFNKLLTAQPSLGHIVGHEWNTVEWAPEYSSSTPHIIAWHGKPDWVLPSMQPRVAAYKAKYGL